MKNLLLKGAVTELIATFAEDESFDLGMFNNQIDYQIEKKIDGFFLNGLAGEYMYTSMEEKLEMTRATVKKAGGKISVVGNIAETNRAEAFRLLHAYEEVGVDGICITQPMVHPVLPDQMVAFFSDLASATKLPVYVYNAPQTSNSMSPEIVAKIINENENAIGYKDSTQDIIHLQSVVASVERDDFECLAGSDATIYPTLALGGCGIISLISALFPEPIIDVCNLYFDDNVKASMKKQQEILEIRTALKNAPFLAGYKYAASLVGVPMGVVRRPLGDASPEQKKNIKKNLEDLNLI